MPTTKVLIVSEYHPNEALAVLVGEILLNRSLGPYIKIVRYAGNADKAGSVRNLRKVY